MRFNKKDVIKTIFFIRALYSLNMAERGLMKSWHIEHIGNDIEVTSEKR